MDVPLSTFLLLPAAASFRRFFLLAIAPSPCFQCTLLITRRLTMSSWLPLPSVVSLRADNQSVAIPGNFHGYCFNFSRRFPFALILKLDAPASLSASFTFPRSCVALWYNVVMAPVHGQGNVLVGIFYFCEENCRCKRDGEARSCLSAQRVIYRLICWMNLETFLAHLIAGTFTFQLLGWGTAKTLHRLLCSSSAPSFTSILSACRWRLSRFGHSWEWWDR